MDSSLPSNVIIRNKILSESNQPVPPKQPLLSIIDSDNDDDTNAQKINQISDEIDEYHINETNLIDVENVHSGGNLYSGENVQSQNEAASQPHTSKVLQSSTAVNTAANSKTHFAQSRIKTIMKLDPELSLTSKESVFLVSKATEYFVEFISKESYKFTSQASRKTLQKKDIEQAINLIDSLYFLESSLD